MPFSPNNGPEPSLTRSTSPLILKSLKKFHKIFQIGFSGLELANINSPSRVRRERVLRLEILPCVPQGPFSFFTPTKWLSPKKQFH